MPSVPPECRPTTDLYRLYRALWGASRVGGKKLIDRLSTKAEVEDGKSMTSLVEAKLTVVIARMIATERTIPKTYARLAASRFASSVHSWRPIDAPGRGT